MPASSVIYTKDRAIHDGEWIPISTWGVSEIVNLCKSFGIGVVINIDRMEFKFIKKRRMKFEGGDL